MAIPKSVSKQRIEQNFQVFDFELTNDEMERINGMDRNWRALLLDDLKDHPEYPYNIEF